MTGSSATGTVRLTVAQATVRFLGRQWTERDGERQRLFAGCFGIFGHGNVAGIGQALLQEELAATEDGRVADLPYVLARNEQAMVHASVAYARQQDRLSTWVCTASIGPGSTNMLTGAALATVNRLPVLLLPSGSFATRVSAPVLQELELPHAGDITVNDAFRPLSRFFDEVARPEQLPSALLGAMRVLTDPAGTGAVTISLPQDVQAEAHDWPLELFEERVWYVPRPRPDAERVAAAAAIIRTAKRPLVVAGGGVHYSRAEAALEAFCSATGIPSSETQAGKGSLPHGHPRQMGAIGSTGTTAANALAAEADVVIGIGTRYADFTTASRTAFQDSGVRFVNLNIAGFDAGKHSGYAVVGDAREALTALTGELDGWAVPSAYRTKQTELWEDWDAQVEAAYHPPPTVTEGLEAGLLTQAEVIGCVNERSDPRDVVLCAAGSMPGDLHKLWRVRDRKGYHVEYGFSCMGYEVAGGLGIKMAALEQDEDREVVVMVGDGSWLMMSTELVTAVAEGLKIIVILVQNHGYASIGALSESLGSQRFGTQYRHRTDSGLDGDTLPVDLAANAASLGADVLVARSADELEASVRKARDSTRTTVIHVETDPAVPAPDSPAWWDVPVAEVSTLDSTRAARATYDEHKRTQRPLITPTRTDEKDER